MNPKQWSARVLLAIPLLVAGPAWAETAPAAASADPEAEAQAFLKTWTESGKPLCEKNEPGCAAAGQALVAAAAAFEAAYRLDKALVTRKMILDPKNRLDYTDYGKETAFGIAWNYQTIAEYAEAASHHEAAARKFPAMAQATAALTEAVTLRMGMKDRAKVAEDIELFEKLYGAKQPEEAARLAVAMAAFLVDEESFSEARTWLGRWMTKVDRSGTLDQKIFAHTLLGRTLAKLDDKKAAANEFEIVRAAWKDPEAALKQLDAMGGTEKERDRRLGRALTNVGEAVFFFAEQKRADADTVRYPEYKGKADRESILAHINTKVVDWVKKKRAAIQDAEKAYMAVISLEPMPPPQWVIASSARVGQMWGRFVAEFRAAPIPKEWKGNGKVPGTDVTFADVRKAYYEMLDEASAPQKQTAKAAYQVCVKYSVKYQHFDEYSRQCNVWLSKNFGKEYVFVEEFVPKPAGTAFVVLPSPVGKAESPR